MKSWISGAMLVACALQAPVALAGPAIQAFEPDSLRSIVQHQRGEPFVLMVWSLDCTYCAASLALLAQEKKRHKRLRVVTLTTDSVQDPQLMALVRKKLAAAGLSTHAWAFGQASPEQLRYAIDPRWYGEVPRSYWIDAKGRATAHSGMVTAAMVHQLLGVAPH